MSTPAKTPAGHSTTSNFLNPLKDGHLKINNGGMTSSNFNVQVDHASAKNLNPSER